MGSFPSVSPRALAWVLRLYGWKNVWRDSRGFGVIRRKRVNNRVLDGTNRAPWGGMGRTWDYVGGSGGRRIGGTFPLRLEED